MRINAEKFVKFVRRICTQGTQSMWYWRFWRLQSHCVSVNIVLCCVLMYIFIFFFSFFSHYHAGIFLLSGPKMGFSPAGATRCPDKREIWHGGADCQISRLSGQNCGNTTPKTVKISNFGQKFVPQRRIVCNIFTKFSAFVRIYRYHSF